jgi:hypothetical protein
MSLYACRVLILSVCAGLAGQEPAHAQDAREGLIRAASHTVVFQRVPHNVPTSAMVDGPIMGNGDLGVVIGGPGAEQVFYLGKNDFWSVNEAMLMPVGMVRVRIPALEDATYRQEQDLAKAEVRGTFTKDSTQVQTRSWVAATENLLVTELANWGDTAVKVIVQQDVEKYRPPQPKEKDDPAKPMPINNIPGWMGDPALIIGCNTSAKEPGLFFDGCISGVRIHERVLAPEEIQSLMKGAVPRRGLLLNWPEECGAETQTQNGRAISGKGGAGVEFSGRDSFAHCGQIRGSTEAVSVSAWVKSASLMPKGGIVAAKFMAYDLELQDGQVRFTIHSKGYNVANTAQNWAQTTVRLSTNEWHHLAGVYDGYGITLYVDGVKAKTTESYTSDLTSRIRPAAAQSPAAVKSGAQTAGDLASNDRIKAFMVDAHSGLCAVTRKAEEKGRGVSFATRVMAENVGGDTNSLGFELKPGQTVRLATAALSDLDNPGHPEAVKARVAALDARELKRLESDHRQWWERYWSKSFIEISDRRIEQFWYGSLYVLGSCSRAGKVAPGLWGNWICAHPMSYRGDFTLNYNFEAPYYITYGANHVELTPPYYQAIAESMENGRLMARTNGWKGIHFPAHIGPWGLKPEGWNDFHQRSNASYAAMPFIWHYYYTQDLEWLRTIGYPYVKEVAAFWENYLKFEPFDKAQGGNGRYVICKDAIHEGTGDETNNVLSLGFVRAIFKAMLQFSTDLGVDEARRDKWRHILAHISEFPTQQRNGKTVFRYTEKGLDWFVAGTLGIQQIFPGGAFGLESDPKMLEICRDTITELNRWSDVNGFSSIYTAAARVGYDPDEILRHLRTTVQWRGQANLTLEYAGGGIENNSGFLTLNEMLLQSHEGVLRFFPCWNKEKDARFGGLRTYGAFLVSAELKGGKVRGVRILSEKGKDCTVQNPWPGSAVRIARNGKRAETITGERFVLKTHAGELVELMPVKK